MKPLGDPLSQRVLDQLREKAGEQKNLRYSWANRGLCKARGVRMPSIKDIHTLLSCLEIPHEFRSSENIVEYRSKGKQYVNSRHRGRRGWRLEVELPSGQTLSMDSSNSYYSFNSHRYAKELVDLIEFQN